VAPRTVVRDVRKLPGGHLLSIGPEGRTVRAWYEPRFRTGSTNGFGRFRRSVKPAELAEEFGALLAQASRRCLVSDVPVALLLSDGIDSNSIRYALAESGQQVSTFTYVMTDEKEGLVPAAPQNGFAGSSWDLLVTPRGRLDTLDEAFARFTEPLGDGASLATWLLIRAARPHATVFLCGHGSDEVLGGYRLSQDRFRLAMMKGVAWLPAWSLKLLVDNKTFGSESPALRQRRLRAVPRRRIPEATRYLIHRPLPYGDVREIRGTDEAPGYLDTVDRLYGGCSDDAADLDRIQEVMIRTFLAEDILSFADSVAMDSSAELRLPFLDRDLVEFVFGLPPGMRVSRWPGRANTKQILRHWGESHLPRDLVERRKRNFNYGTVRELLAEDTARVHDRMLGASAVRRALPGLETWLGHPREYFRGPWEGTMWALLSLGIWAEATGIE